MLMRLLWILKILFVCTTAVQMLNGQPWLASWVGWVIMIAWVEREEEIVRDGLDFKAVI